MGLHRAVSAAGLSAPSRESAKRCEARRHLARRMRQARPRARETLDRHGGCGLNGSSAQGNRGGDRP
ncbi:hypothetical protein Lokhon_02357 [Limimaricola hongkongensis DSM 17492]|uniref:Uncharacterized protein n=1 Tax=Limimaricola hongkongensis DSM 17492 TaxID=1122180 RepID=A0A017H8K9_9RHOB|nr:hypothetical protein Lokhon_02357 [Limimaricola hongkongensis DSM 17492]